MIIATLESSKWNISYWSHKFCTRFLSASRGSKRNYWLKEEEGEAFIRCTLRKNQSSTIKGVEEKKSLQKEETYRQSYGKVQPKNAIFQTLIRSEMIYVTEMYRSRQNVRRKNWKWRILVHEAFLLVVKLNFSFQISTCCKL